jgi:hypothetical protein
MRNGDIGSMYRANKIYSSPASVAKHGTIVSVPHNGRRLAMQAKPIAQASVMANRRFKFCINASLLGSLSLGKRLD